MAVSFIPVDPIEDFEVYMVASGADDDHILGRMTGISASTISAIRASFIGNYVTSIEQYLNGSHSQLNGMPSDSSVNKNASKFEVRFRVVGPSAKLKVWAFGSPEPSLWTRENNSMAITNPGYIGFGSYRSKTVIYQYSVGLNGDSAPKTR